MVQGSSKRTVFPEHPQGFVQGDVNLPNFNTAIRYEEKGSFQCHNTFQSNSKTFKMERLLSQEAYDLMLSDIPPPLILNFSFDLSGQNLILFLADNAVVGLECNKLHRIL